MVLIAVSIAAADLAGVAAQAESARAGGADLVEVRIDRCVEMGASAEGLIAALPTLPLPAIVTIRHASEGGAWRGDEGSRLRLLLDADARGAAYIDCEFARLGDLPRRPTRAKLIVSHHDLVGMSGDLVALAKAMAATGADVVKIAVTPLDAADLGAVELLYQAVTVPLIAIAMGDIGLPSRLLAGAWGSYLTFARLDDCDGSAPGQPCLSELIDLYRVRDQGPDTRIYGVVGNPVAHSLSPLIHNRAFASHKIDAVYVPFLVEDAAAFWQACGAWIDGLSITIPHKQALLTSVDELEPLARAIGAINTIYRDAANRTIGANTDAQAAVECVEAQVGSLNGRMITLLGAGGVSRAIALAVRERGAQLTIANRGHDRAEELAREVGAVAVEWAQAVNVPYDVLVNGTSIGMGNESETPWPASAHRPDTVVFDTVYTPLETRLIKDAQLAHCTAICGLSMFIRQALGQYKRWTGLDAPEPLMYRLALERLSESHPLPPIAHKTATHERRLDGAFES